MPKKKRTRQQKVQTDEKRQSASPSAHVNTASAVTRERKDYPDQEVTPIGTFSLPEKYTTRTKPQRTTQPATTHTVAIATSEYGYLRGDLLKTTILSLGIVAIEIIVYFFVMN